MYIDNVLQELLLHNLYGSQIYVSYISVLFIYRDICPYIRFLYGKKQTER